MFFQKNYSRDERDFDDPLLCLFHGLLLDFLVITECDIFADENRVMAEALRNANVEVEERAYQGATHSFLEVLRITAISNKALDEDAR